MLFVETRTLGQHVDGATRTLLLEKLQGRGLVPLVRSARLHLYELALAGANRAPTWERWSRRARRSRGDTLTSRRVFARTTTRISHLRRAEGEQPAARGRVMCPTPSAARDKLEAFCRGVSDALAEASATPGRARSTPFEWEDAESRVPEGFRRFAAARDEAPLFESRGEMVEGWLRSSGLLEDGEARRALRRLHEAHQEGRGAAIPTGTDADAVPESLLGSFPSRV